MLILAVAAVIACHVLKKRGTEDWLVGGLLCAFIFTTIVSFFINRFIPTETKLSFTEDPLPFFDQMDKSGPFLLERSGDDYTWFVAAFTNEGFSPKYRERSADYRATEILPAGEDMPRVEAYVVIMKPPWQLIVFPPELGQPRFIYKIYVTTDSINFNFQKTR